MTRPDLRLQEIIGNRDGDWVYGKNPDQRDSIVGWVSDPPPGPINHLHQLGDHPRTVSHREDLAPGAGGTSAHAFLHDPDLLIGHIVKVIDQPVNLSVCSLDLALEAGYFVGCLGDQVIKQLNNK